MTSEYEIIVPIEDLNETEKICLENGCDPSVKYGFGHICKVAIIITADSSQIHNIDFFSHEKHVIL